MKRTFAKWIINWIWYLRLEQHEDGSVTIERYWREHGTRDLPSAEAKIAEHIPFAIGESPERNILVVNYNGMNHPVRNSKYIFSYNK